MYALGLVVTVALLKASARKCKKTPVTVAVVKENNRISPWLGDEEHDKSGSVSTSAVQEATSRTMQSATAFDANAAYEEQVEMVIGAPLPGATPTQNRHKRCQIVYYVGVEGSMHHYAGDVLLRNLARMQRSSGAFVSTADGNEMAMVGTPFEVHFMDQTFRCSDGFVHRNFNYCKKMGRGGGAPTANEILDKVCPDDGRHHVIIDGVSFPSGLARTHPERTDLEDIADRVGRGRVAMDLERLARFVHGSGREDVEVKYVLMWRNFPAAVASHSDWDADKKQHATVLAGNLLYLSALFRRQRADGLGFVFPRQSWKVLCTDSLQESEGRKNDAAQLAKFLGWNTTFCPSCENHYHPSTKVPSEVLGTDDYNFAVSLTERYRGAWWPFLGGGNADIRHARQRLVRDYGSCPL